MFIEYLLLTFTKEGTNVNDIMKVLTNKIFELKKLEETRFEAIVNTREQQWKRALWSQNHNCPKSFKLGDFVFWFPKRRK
jgi:hypothetical protein